MISGEGYHIGVWVWGVLAKSGTGEARLKGRILRHVDCGNRVSKGMLAIGAS
jgi:hypothetical protein